MGILINNFFNFHEHQTIESSDDTIKALIENNLDYLILEDKIIKFNK